MFLLSWFVWTACGCLRYDADAITLAVKSSCGQKIWKLHGDRQFRSSLFPVRARSNKTEPYRNRSLQMVRCKGRGAPSCGTGGHWYADLHSRISAYHRTVSARVCTALLTSVVWLSSSGVWMRTGWSWQVVTVCFCQYVDSVIMAVLVHVIQAGVY